MSITAEALPTLDGLTSYVRPHGLASTVFALCLPSVGGTSLSLGEGRGGLPSTTPFAQAQGRATLEFANTRHAFAAA